MRVLFEAPTVAALAVRIEQLRADEADHGGAAPAADTAETGIPRLART
jgi:hypothetical protein